MEKGISIYQGKSYSQYNNEKIFLKTNHFLNLLTQQNSNINLYSAALPIL